MQKTPTTGEYRYDSEDHPEKYNGCGLCATACHEGANDIINGKAKLVRENFWIEHTEQTDM